MSQDSCVFCKIIKKEIPAKIIKENECVMVIEDIFPKAPVHYLILPKKHIINFKHLQDCDCDIIWQMARMVQEVAKKFAIKSEKESSFNIISNNGADAGQSVFHMHWHFISGKNIYLNGLEL